VPSEIVLIGDQFFRVIHWEDFQWQQVPRQVLKWVTRNFVYFLGRIVVLAPVVSLFVPSSIQRIIRSPDKKNSDPAYLSITLLILHLVISCIWPVFKFRYFVPILPLVFGIGSYGLFIKFKKSKYLTPLLILTLLAILAINTLTYFRVPTHTSYYDNNEFFHYRTGEADWQNKERFLIDAANMILSDANTTVIGPLELFFYLHRPIVILPEYLDSEIIQYLVNRFSIDYIIDKHYRQSVYENALHVEIIYRNQQYSVWRVIDLP
jgi:hypothetical protein